MTTPENTDEVFCIFSTIKLEYDLYAVDQKEGLSSEGYNITSEPLQNFFFSKQGPQNVHAKFRNPNSHSRPYHLCNLQKPKERRNGSIVSDLENVEVSTIKSKCQRVSRTIIIISYIVEIFDFRSAVYLGLKMRFQLQYPGPVSQSRELSRVGSISVFIRVFPITETVDRVSLRPE